MGIFLGTADGKFNIDDHAIDRFPQYEKSRAYYKTDLEYEAALEGTGSPVMER